MSIQQEVLDCIGPNGIAAKELRSRLGNLPQNELDVCTGALMRSRKITLSFGRFELTGAKPARSEVPAEPTSKHESMPPQSVAQVRPERTITAVAPSVPAAAIKVTAPVVERTEPQKSAPVPKPEAPKQPVIADRVFEKVKTERQDAVDQVARLHAEAKRLRTVADEREAEASKLKPYIAERDHFIELYEKLAEGAQ